jgi:hypothetical protein
MGFGSGLEGTGPVLNRSVTCLSGTWRLLPRSRSGLENMYESEPWMIECSGEGLRAVNVPEVAKAGVGDLERARCRPWTIGKSRMAKIYLNLQVLTGEKDQGYLARTESGASTGSPRSSPNDGNSRAARSERTCASQRNLISCAQTESWTEAASPTIDQIDFLTSIIIYPISPPSSASAAAFSLSSRSRRSSSSTTSMLSGKVRMAAIPDRLLSSARYNERVTPHQLPTLGDRGQGLLTFSRVVHAREYEDLAAKRLYVLDELHKFLSPVVIS